MWNINAPQYSLRDFHKTCRICSSFQDALAVKISLVLLEGLWSYGGFNLTVSGYPQIFSAPSGETNLCVRPPNVFKVHERARGPLSPCQVSWGSDNVELFCLSVTLLNVRVSAPDFTMKTLEYRNDFDAVG